MMWTGEWRVKEMNCFCVELSTFEKFRRTMSGGDRRPSSSSMLFSVGYVLILHSSVISLPLRA